MIVFLTTVSAPGLASRESTVSYDGDQYKRFATSATNALNHTASSRYVDRFGAAAETIDANNIKSRTRYDRLGRRVASYSSLGVNQSTTFSSSAVAGAVMSMSTTTSGAPTSTSHVDMLGREIRRDTQDFVAILSASLPFTTPVAARPA